MPIEDELRELQVRVSQATSVRAREDVERENAMATVAEVKKLLKEEFGVETNEDLKQVKEKLEADLQAEIELVRSELQKANA